MRNINGFLEVLMAGMLLIPGQAGFTQAQNAVPALGAAQAQNAVPTQAPAPVQEAAPFDAAAVLNTKDENAPYFQHVEVTAPEGVCIAPASDGRFLAPLPAPQLYGFQVGTLYRLHVTNIPQMTGVELYPSIEILDRTHPPIGEEIRHAVVIELTQDDLYAAIRGKFVTRVIYIEDPATAFPISSKDQKGQGYFDVPAESDPILVAKTLGRPIAILRIGGRAPGIDEEIDAAFLNNCPPFLHYPPAK